MILQNSGQILAKMIVLNFFLKKATTHPLKKTRIFEFPDQNLPKMMIFDTFLKKVNPLPVEIPTFLTKFCHFGHRGAEAVFTGEDGYRTRWYLLFNNNCAAFAPFKSYTLTQIREFSGVGWVVIEEEVLCNMRYSFT